MADAGELCHCEIVDKMAVTIAAANVKDIATWVVGIQREHIQTVRRASLQLPTEHIQATTSA